MKGNIEITRPNRYVQIEHTAANNTFVIVGGAAGWIDTDISASDVPVNAYSIQILIDPDLAQAVGARASGVTVDTKLNAPLKMILLSSHNTTRHLDLYRSLNNNNYYIMGYFV